jgi:probable phosphoglycerate mutase
VSRHVFLIRHGESAWNAIARLQGQADAPLSELGREQARALATTLSALGPMSVVSSDLSRAFDTGVLAGHDGAELDARWRERGLGVWEGQLEADVPAAELSAFRHGDHVPDGGETWAAFQDRVGEALDELSDRGGSWFVFTHGGCVRAAIAHATGADHRTIAGPANTSLTLLEVGARRRLLAFNWTAPAGGRAAVPRASEPGGAEIPLAGADPENAAPGERAATADGEQAGDPAHGA